MKTLVFFGIFLGLTFEAIAQQSHAETSVVTTSTYTWTDSNNSPGKGHGNITISISQSEDNYHLAANFTDDQYIQLREILFNEFGKEDLKNGRVYEWRLGSNVEEAYKIKLSPETLQMNLNKNLSSRGLQEKFINVGKIIKDNLSDNRNISVEKLERMAESMKKEAMQIENKIDELLDQKELLEGDRKKIDQLMEKAEKLIEKANELLKAAEVQERDIHNEPGSN